MNKILEEKLEEKIDHLERIIVNINNNVKEGNKIIREINNKLDQQLLIIDNILKKINKYKNLDINDIINATTYTKKNVELKETNKVLKEIYNLIIQIEDNFKKLFGE